MNITHTILVLLNDGRVQRHYVEALKDGEDKLEYYMYLRNGYLIGWKVDDSFYTFENITGFGIGPFKGIIVMVDSYSVIVEEANDLYTAIQAQIGARFKEIKALQGYLERDSAKSPNPDILKFTGGKQLKK